MGLITEYINKRISIKELEDELLQLIKIYNKERSANLFVYAAAIGKNIPDIALSMDDYYVICDLIRTSKSERLDIYIQTPGGSGEAAEEIVRFLRNKFKKVDFIVSGEAKSAGTLIVLSGNEILMTESGSLGPIDAQMKVGRSIVSAFDYIEWIESKRAEATRTGKLNPFDATVIAQISPGELNGVAHALDFAKDLVIEWLPKYKFKDWNITETKKTKVTYETKTKRAKEIADALSNHARWRSHGRSLKIADLEEIGLKINKVDENPRLSDIVYRIQTVIKMLFDSTTTYKLFALEDEKIFKHAVQVGRPPEIKQGKPETVEVKTKCSKCEKDYLLYAKFIKDPKIDEKFKPQGALLFPNNNKLICECGFEIDLSGIRNDIESQVAKIV